MERFRLRAFSGLKSSYSVPTMPSYRPFYVKYRVKNVILQGELPSILPSGMLVRVDLTSLWLILKVAEQKTKEWQKNCSWTVLCKSFFSDSGVVSHELASSDYRSADTRFYPSVGLLIAIIRLIGNYWLMQLRLVMANDLSPFPLPPPARDSQHLWGEVDTLRGSWHLPGAVYTFWGWSTHVGGSRQLTLAGGS